MAEHYVEKSPADFFYENRAIAGFDNPVRAAYSAIRELVENALDACEENGILPDIEITVEKGESGGEWVIKVKDNGTGIPAEVIPECFGKVLFSSKYGNVQRRGRFGMGGTMAVLYGQITTNKPVHVRSSVGDGFEAEMDIKIDIQGNRPIAVPPPEKALKKSDNPWHGTEVTLHIEAEYPKARQKVYEYLKHTAVVAPYMNLRFKDPYKELIFTRKTEKLPAKPREVKYHPEGVDLETLRRMIANSRANTITGFLTSSFQRLGHQTAKKIIEIARLENKNPRRLSDRELLKLYKAMKNTDYQAPDPSCLSPLGVELLKAGVIKEFNPEFAEAVQRPPRAYQGHPFIVELAIAYGGNVPATPDFLLFRFANKIPLLYDEYSDVSSRVIRQINWSRYGIKPEMPIAIFVHVVSTKIPFKTLGKEYIAYIPEIAREIEIGLRELARKLSLYLSKKKAAMLAERRERTLLKYAKWSSALISEVLPVEEGEVYELYVRLVRSKTGGAKVGWENTNS